MNNENHIKGLIVKTNGLVSASTNRISTMFTDVFAVNGERIGMIELDQLAAILKQRGFEIADTENQAKNYLQVDGKRYEIVFVDTPRAIAYRVVDGSAVQVDLPVFTLITGKRIAINTVKEVK